jgi:anaerobic selenocysteine-containing dehydrogenase
MGESTISRRSFLKLSAVTAAAVGLGSAVSTKPTLAEAADDTTSSTTSDVKRVRTCCRACGKMECGVWVTVENGRAIKIEGDTSAFQSAGNCCTKSQSSIQVAYHPDRITYPMKRTNPRDADDPGWVRISWDEAMQTVGDKFNEIIDKYGPDSLFTMAGTSRVWSMQPYSAYKNLLQTANAIIPWQVCKGPRHFATQMQSAFSYSWQATVDKPRVMVRWGGATEISNYDDSCRTAVDAAKEADEFIVVDPRLTNLGKDATIWQHLYPQTDAALALSWANVIIENDLYDELMVKKWTNAPFLVCMDMEPSGPYSLKFWSATRRVQREDGTYEGMYEVKTHLLKESDLVEGGSKYRFMVWDSINNRLTYYDAQAGVWEGQTFTPPTKGKQAQQEHLYPGLEQGWVPDETGFTQDDGFETEIDPALYGEYEVTLKDGTVHTVRPVWEHFRDRCAEYEPEKAAEITGIPAEEIEHAAKTYATRIDPSTGYGNGGIGYMLAEEHGCNSIQNCRILDVLVAITGNWDTPGGNRGPTYTAMPGYQFAQDSMNSEYYVGDDDVMSKIAGGDRFPLLKWWQWWADANSAYEQMVTGDPYPIVGGICESGDFMNMGNALYNWEALNNLEFFAVVDLWHTPLSDKADILMPCYHWLEVTAPRPSQGSSGAFGANVACIETRGECHYDPIISRDLHKAMGVPYSTVEGTDPWPDLETILDDSIPRAAQVGINSWQEFEDDFEKNGWWDCKAKYPDYWGTYRRYEMGRIRSDGKQGFNTPTGKIEIWSTIMETFYPEESDILPDYREAPQSRRARPDLEEDYPFICNTGRRIPVYFHSEHRQLPWCREQWPVPRMEIHPSDAEKIGVKQGDWVWIESPEGNKVRQTVDIYEGIQPGIINAEHQWWYPELDQAGKGFELSGINCLVTRNDQDRHCGSSYLRAYPVKVYKATAENSPFGDPVPCGNDGTEIIHDASDPRLKEWLPTYDEEA